MISKTKINKRSKRKTNTELVETINLAKKNNLLNLAKKLTSSNKNQTKINVSDLDESEVNKVIVVGKVLGQGEINKKVEVAALSFSNSALEKLKKAECKTMNIKKAIESKFQGEII